MKLSWARALYTASAACAMTHDHYNISFLKKQLSWLYISTSAKSFVLVKNPCPSLFYWYQLIFFFSVIMIVVVVIVTVIKTIVEAILEMVVEVVVG